MYMKEYLNLFIDKIYPDFLDKYTRTKTLRRLKHVSQFCGCDYTALYSPLFKYSRFDHSLVVAHMTWHFTRDKKETITALLHDIGTPCFAHTVDLVFGDYMNQETSERSLIDVINKDRELKSFLAEDNISQEDILNYPNYHILENKSPKLCTDRLDGVLHTCYIWLHTHSLEQIKEVYDDLVVLQNEEGYPEIGFQHINIAEKFVSMVYNYAHELQFNKDKYVMHYISKAIQMAFKNNLLSLEDLYSKKEVEICQLFKENFSSWGKFKKTKQIKRCDRKPASEIYVSFETKKRNTIPLVQTHKKPLRIDTVSENSKDLYSKLANEKDTKYAYVEGIERIN